MLSNAVEEPEACLSLPNWNSRPVVALAVQRDVGSRPRRATMLILCRGGDGRNVTGDLGAAAGTRSLGSNQLHGLGTAAALITRCEQRRQIAASPIGPDHTLRTAAVKEKRRRGDLTA